MYGIRTKARRGELAGPPPEASAREAHTLVLSAVLMGLVHTRCIPDSYPMHAPMQWSRLRSGHIGARAHVAPRRAPRVAARRGFVRDERACKDIADLHLDVEMKMDDMFASSPAVRFKPGVHKAKTKYVCKLSGCSSRPRWVREVIICMTMYYY